MQLHLGKQIFWLLSSKIRHLFLSKRPSLLTDGLFDWFKMLPVLLFIYLDVLYYKYICLFHKKHINNSAVHYSLQSQWISGHVARAKRGRSACDSLKRKTFRLVRTCRHCGGVPNVLLNPGADPIALKLRLHTFKCLMACSVTSSSFLFHSTQLIRLVQIMLIMLCSERLAFFISSLVKAIIWGEKHDGLCYRTVQYLQLLRHSQTWKQRKCQ